MSKQPTRHPPDDNRRFIPANPAEFQGPISEATMNWATKATLASAVQHWESFRQYLQSTAEDGHPRQNKAREKLTRLNQIQFRELSTDVYDELQRRLSDRSEQFLATNDHIHPKRNQARQKLASLATRRFKDLVSDVFFEIERRFPQIEHQGSCVSTKFKQDTLLPNKSTLMEEDDASDYDIKSPRTTEDDSSIRSSEYTSKNTYASADSGIDRNSLTSLSTGIYHDRDKTTKDYEQRIGALQDKVATLESALREKNNSGQTKALMSANIKIEELEALLKNARLSAPHGLERSNQSAELAELRLQNEKLQQELEEQQQVTEEVRQKATGFLSEMRALSQRENSVWAESERLSCQVAALQKELTEWKARYARSQRESRQLKTNSVMSVSADAVNLGPFLYSVTGILETESVRKFQISIDEILRVARNQPLQTLEAAKSLVEAAKAIISDLTHFDSGVEGNKPLVEKIFQFRGKINVLTNSLVLACKNHVRGAGVSPIGLVDAAASHLSSTLVEVARTCKIKPVEHPPVASEFTDQGLHHSHRTKSPQFGEGHVVPIKLNGLAPTMDESPSLVVPLGSPASMPKIEVFRDLMDKDDTETNVEPVKRDGTSLRPNLRHSQSLYQLKLFLESQTEGIVSSIHNLLASIRANAKMPILHGHMEDIVAIVTKVTNSMEKAMDTSSDLDLVASEIVKALDICCLRMREMQEVQIQVADKVFKQKLAVIAFDTAKQTKELSIVLQGTEHEVDLT